MIHPSSFRLSWIEKAALIHACVLLLGSSWAFGGNIWWARQALCIWGTLALPLTAILFVQAARAEAATLGGKAWWLLPPALYAVLVLASTFNPSFTAKFIESERVLAHTGAAHSALPSTVNGAASLKALWFGAGAYLSAFNLAIALRSRTPLRLLLGIVALDACLLAVFGTVQKLASAGFYFGAATSPNARFFSTFIYYNHWGAWMILGLGATAGLMFYHAARHRGRDLWHSPVTAIAGGVLVIAASGPVSASRAAAGMTAVLVVILTVHALFVISSARRRERRRVWPMVALVLALVGACAGAVTWLAARSINQRIHETRASLASGESLWGERMVLYRDTWELASRKPLFGWGLDSYEVAIQTIRPRAIQVRYPENSYGTAHNDWLQSLAETGFVGTALLVAAFLLPLARVPRKLLLHPLVLYPFTSLGLVLLYAWIEFPFSNAAFVILFWILFFTTLRHAELTEKLTREP